MAEERECNCCHEAEGRRMSSLLDEGIQCMTEHPGFQSVYLKTSGCWKQPTTVLNRTTEKNHCPENYTGNNFKWKTVKWKTIQENTV